MRALALAAFLVVLATLPTMAQAQVPEAPEATPPEAQQPAAPPQPSTLGDVGESCRARVDCRPGLKCIANVCSAPSPAPAPAPAAPPAGAPTPSPHQGPSMAEWMGFQLQGPHFYVGMLLAPGVSVPIVYETDELQDASASFLMAFRFGLLINKFELGMEFSPMATVANFDDDPSLSLVVHVGGLPFLTDYIYWPLRFGVGMVAVNTPNDNVLFHTRFDLLGIGVKLGHVLLEFQFPSFRYTTDFDLGGIFSWAFGISAVYVI